MRNIFVAGNEDEARVLFQPRKLWRVPLSQLEDTRDSPLVSRRDKEDDVIESGEGSETRSAN